jgi:hypothetical protein
VPKESKLRLVARFDEPGAWMYHCHILEHAEGRHDGRDPRPRVSPKRIGVLPPPAQIRQRPEVGREARSRRTSIP